MIKIKKFILISLIFLTTNIFSSELAIPITQEVFDTTRFNPDEYSSDESAYESETDMPVLSELEKAEKELQELNNKYNRYIEYKNWLELKINSCNVDKTFSHNEQKTKKINREIKEREKELKMAHELYPKMLAQIKLKLDAAQYKYDKLLSNSESKFRNLKLKLPSLDNNTERDEEYAAPTAPALGKNKKRFSWGK